MMMKLALVSSCLLLALSGVSGVEFTQDPCANCDEELAIKFQKCARDHGNPCAETNEDGLVTGKPGTKKDVGCCMKREKHHRCLQCKGMDCSHNTCKVNKKYYAERQQGEDHTGWEAEAKKGAGWGGF